jgi:7-cyano-7-deazaguanine synthase in queuosine biosynthesis
MSRSIVLLSGGHHSAAALLLARQQDPDVKAIHIAMDRHGAEGLHAARRFSERAGVPCAMMPAHNYGRGYLADMLRQAAGLAALEGISDVYLGVWDMDGNTRGYLEATQAAERERTNNPALTFHLPMLGTTPDLPFGIAESFAQLTTLIEDTHSCDRPVRHTLGHGYGCGECASCVRRATGWNTFTATEMIA